MLSDPAIFTVTDPCRATEIIQQTSIPNDVFVIYQTGKVILPEFLSNANFPDSVSLQAESDGYGSNVCGDNVYSIVFAFTGYEAPFFTQNIYGDMIFQPTVDDSAGFFPMALIISKQRYGEPDQSQLDFTAEITLDQGGDVEAGNDPFCNDAFIDLNGASIPNTFHLWGSVVPSTTAPFSPFIPVSEYCPDLMVYYSAEYFDENTGSWTTLPSSNNEILFNPNERTFTIDKCGPLSSSGDIECDLPVYTKIIQMKVTGTVNNMILTHDSFEFTVYIGPDCSSNEVYLVIPLQSFTYNIRPSAEATVMEPLFSMSNIGCALRCYLYETGVEPLGYSSPAISSFNDKNGHVIISTDDVTLDASSIQLTVMCSDPLSELG